MRKTLAMLLAFALLLTMPFAALAEAAEDLFDASEPKTLTLFVDWTWMEYDTFEGGKCQEYLREMTGITVEMQKASDSEQLNLMIAGGDLPDMIACSSTSKVTRLSDSDLCYPLQELIDQYVPQWEISEVEKNVNAYFSDDGNFYMLKNEYNTAEEIKAASNLGINFGQFLVRQDLYEELGSPEVKTKEDFFALMALVKETYPDMQPLVFNTREYSAFGSLVGYDTTRPTNDGKLVMSISDPTYREMLLTMNELYRAGYITKENFSYTSDEQTFQSLYAGDVFMVTHFAGNDEQAMTAKLQASVPGASMEQLPLLDNFKYTMPVSGWAACFITRNCSDPETAIKLLYWSKQQENATALIYGYPGIDWEYDEIGNITMLEPYNTSSANGTATTDYREMAFPLSASNYITIYNGYYAAASEKTRAIFDDAVSRTTFSNAIDLAYPKADTDLYYVSSDISDLVSEYFAKLCTAESEEEFDTLWDTMMATAEDCGLAELNEYLSTTYAEVCELLGCE